MRIKHNDALHTAALHTADELGIKPSRIAAAIRAEQAERLLREDEQAERPSTRKVKAGKQGLPGRTRVDRAREVEVEEVERPIRVIYAEMMDIIREMQQFAAENPPAWVVWAYDRHGRGLTVMASPFNNGPCPISGTYSVSEEGLAQLQEDSGWMA